MNQTSSEEGGGCGGREGRVWNRYAVEGSRHLVGVARSVLGSAQV